MREGKWKIGANGEDDYREAAQDVHRSAEPDGNRERERERRTEEEERDRQHQQTQVKGRQKQAATENSAATRTLDRSEEHFNPDTAFPHPERD